MIEELPDLAAMERFGARIAQRVASGDVVSLTGDLGAGKTTLARFILSALGHTGDVPSPTFTIIETYDDPAMKVAAAHADFYRLDDPSEAIELGLDDYREGRVLIAEWPEKAGGFSAEPGCLSINLEIEDEGRLATVEGGANWVGRMP